jgi:hypothetical protein
MKNINRININAPAYKIFDIITDFQQYPKWNAITPNMSTDLIVGKEFLLDSHISEKLAVKDEPMVMLSFDPDKHSLSWGTSRTKQQYPGIKSERLQVCKKIDDHNTLFINQQIFEGIFSPILYLFIRKSLDMAYKKYCQALKEWAEK